MPDNLKQGHLDSLIKELDELLAEAARVSGEISATMRERPFFPERRRERKPIPKERRINR